MAHPVDIAEMEIARILLRFLHENGRISQYMTLKSYICNNFKFLLDRIRAGKKSFNLFDFIKSQSHMFYEASIENIGFIAIARDYAYLNPRVARLLDSVKCPKMEKFLFKKKPKRFSNLKKYLRNVEQYGEFEFGKCALGFMEILKSISSLTENEKRPLPYSKVLEKLNQLSPFGKCILNSFNPLLSKAESLARFLMEFPTTFSTDGATMGTDQKNLKALTFAFEMDLMWSFAGICVGNGVRTVEGITQELNELRKTIDIKHVADFSTSDTADKILRCRYQVFLLPGDGSVWMMDPTPPISEEMLSEIESFFEQFLVGKSIRFKELLNVANEHSACLKSSLVGLTFLDVASCLYVPKSYRFEEGCVKLASGRPPMFKYINATPMEVPTTYLKAVPTGEIEYEDRTGYVRQVGKNSATVSIEMISAGTKIITDIIAFGHINRTLVDNQRVTDFTKYIQEGDYLSFKANFRTTVTIDCPYQLLMSNLKVQTVMKCTALTSKVDPQNICSKTDEISKDDYSSVPYLSIYDFSKRVPLEGLALGDPQPEEEMKPKKQWRRMNARLRYRAKKEWELRPKFLSIEDDDPLNLRDPPVVTLSETPYYTLLRSGDEPPVLRLSAAANEGKEFFESCPHPYGYKDLKQHRRAAQETSVILETLAETVCSYITNPETKRRLSSYHMMIVRAMHNASVEVGAAVTRSEIFHYLFQTP